VSRQWQFEQDDAGQWRWRRVDETLGNVDSVDSFANEVDCMMDAVRYAVGRRRSHINRDDLLQ